MTDIRNDRTALYRLFDSSNQLLYVGITNMPDRRWGAHTSNTWWKDVARREVTWFEDRASAAAAEVAAIRSEDPIHNGTHSPRRVVMRDTQADDGVREVSLSMARPKLTELIESVNTHGRAVSLLNHGRRRAYLVTPEFYEQAIAAMKY